MQNIFWYQNEQYLSFLHQIVNCYSWCQIVRGVKLSTMWNCPRILQKGTDGRRMRWEGVMCKPLYENWRPVAIIEHGALVPFCSVIFKKVSSLGWIWEGWGGVHYFRVGGVDKYCSAAKWVRLDSCQLPTAPVFMQHPIHHHHCWVPNEQGRKA